MKAIINAKIVMPDYIIPDGSLIIDGEKIAEYGRNIKTDDMEVLDAEGAYVGPGFIELHTHAAKGTFLTEDPVGGAKKLLKHGVTDALAALYFSSTRDELIEQIYRIRNAVSSGKAPNVLGLYMEAPYMNPKFGANRENNPWRYPIRQENYLPLLEAAGDFARVWCLAPEREGILGFVKDALIKNPNAVFSVGHSEATPSQIEALMPYGLKLATHHTNATGTIYKYPECRGVCVDETAWYNHGIYTELICDKMGIHVDPYMIRLVRKIKGDERVVLIADSYVDDGPIPSGYDGADDINFDHAGEISGTKLTLDDTCRNMLYNGGASIPNCFRYASTNPADVLGLGDRGRIGRGMLANLVITDHEFHVRQVMLRGKIQ